MVDYKTYVKMQVETEIIKPVHYHIGEWLAINHFFSGEPRHQKILDVGCGNGYGVGMFNILGFHSVVGVDLSDEKVYWGKHFGYNVYNKDIMDFSDVTLFDTVWCSHAFEHMLYPDKVIDKLLSITADNAEFYFILPYPDLNPSPVHCATPIIGTNIDDQGVTVVNWFKNHGLTLMTKRFDKFREPEIWINFYKS